MINNFLLSLHFYIGVDLFYIKIGDFNEHFNFLTKRANEIGWKGNFRKFKNFNFSPVLSINFRNLYACTGLIFDRAEGNFSYTENNNLFKIYERWTYYFIPVNIYFEKNFEGVFIFSGLEFFFSNLKIDIESNFTTRENYPKRFKGEGMGIILGLKKAFKNLSFMAFWRFAEVSDFHSQGNYLFKSDKGYIYEAHSGGKR
ncbi:MAG: hypothetical protein ABIN20_08295 [candidate division WOR-3 bacterium]